MVLQVLQKLADGETTVTEVPVPDVTSTTLLIRSRHTLISSGTERSLVEFGKANLISKIRQQPEKVRSVLEKARTDGILATAEAVRTKLDQPMPMGYCNVGSVIAVGKEVTGFSVGDRVVSNGPHAEVVRVPRNLCARVPSSVDDEQAVFAVLGSIALQGMRLAAPTLGECFAVMGVGIVGLLAVQLLRANGCRVLALDFDAARLEAAENAGAEIIELSDGVDPVEAAIGYSRGVGVDGVVIAAATTSSDPLTWAARMCRKRGRIVLVGVTGTEFSRSDFYEKELSFHVSCSYGPGRYDPLYEEQGHDYPVGFVRWTEQRNFEAVLDMMADGRLDVAALISSRYPVEQAAEAYRHLLQSPSSLGILLDYSADQEQSAVKRHIEFDSRAAPPIASPTVSFIGAGNYAGRVLIPAFARTGVALNAIASTGGVSGAHYGRKYGFRRATTDLKEVIGDSGTDIVVIATRHDSHAHFAAEALQAGHGVFVEKPLALTQEQLERIERAYRDRADAGAAPVLMVGFNRRFAPLVVKTKELLQKTDSPKAFVYTVNAGSVPHDSWVQDSKLGGGRILGEACHFVDLLRFLADAEIVDFCARAISPAGAMIPPENAAVTLTFSDGSIGTVHYIACGGKKFPKERLEVFCGDAVLQLNNFRSLIGFGWPGFRRAQTMRLNKGQMECAAAFIDSVRLGKPVPIPFAELMEVSRISIEVSEMLSQQGAG